MKRITSILFLSLAIMLAGQHKASAQLVTFDEQNFLQAIISYIQDGDNMVQNASQFAANMGIIEEQLDNLKKWNDRYQKVSSYLAKGQQAVYTVNNYEYTIKLFKEYVNRLKVMDKPSYYDIRSATNQAWYFLILSSREVKKVRQALDASSELTEAERLKILEDSNKKMSAVNVAMTKEVKEQLSVLEDAHTMALYSKSIENSLR
ncbi:MAG: hypothetical protein KBS89_05050 [Bacteroidales bacterium]|nr:hypothetical protein [Candidatus Egerieousia equi]